MKRTYLFLMMALLMMAAVCITGCQKTGDYRDVIPANASAVLSLNVKHIAEKGEISALLSQTKEMKVMIGDQNAEIIEKLLTDSKTEGLALEEKIFVFGFLKEEIWGLVAKVSDETKVKEMFVTLQKSGVCGAPEKQGGYTWVSIGNVAWCVFDETRLLIVPSDNNTKEIAGKWMAQKAGNSMMANKGFQKMITRNDDATIFMSIATLSQEYCNETTKQMMLSGVDITKIDMMGGITFEKGKIALNMEYIFADKEAEELYEKQMAAYGKLNNTFLNYFPASALCYMAANVKGADTYRLMEEFNIFENLKIKQQEGGPDIKKLMGSFNGDISLGILNLSEMGIPSLLAYAEVEDSYPLKVLADLQKEFRQYAEIKSIGENAYEANIMMLNMKIWFGIQDKHLYLTNDPVIYQHIDRKVENPFGDTPYAAGFKNACMGAVVNIDATMKLPVMQTVWMMAGMYGPMAQSGFSGCDYIEMLTVSPTLFEMNIYVKDKEQNVLKQMLWNGQNLR